jgi:hypothetical protein
MKSTQNEPASPELADISEIFLDEPSPEKRPDLHGLPHRYEIKDTADGKALTCLEAPNIVTRIQSGLAVSAAVARKSAEGTIYLDGVAQCEPFMDHKRQVYNFDHHEGCLRPFTLSTCEQVLVMILKGLDLRGRDWNVFANEPDLDTILAIWLLFNHLRLHQSNGVRQLLYALIRVEGIIDAHGLEFMAISGFPEDLLETTKNLIDDLRTEELALKKEGRWAKTDYLEYTIGVLHKIDQLIYQSDDFVDFKGIKELSRVKLFNDRIAAVVHSDLGIYEVEPHLQRIYGDRLGLAILNTGENTYTLRLMDPFMPGDLNRVYQQLNYEDPAVRRRSDSNKWGGSADIGGSPRGIGTRLTPEQIVGACAEAFMKPTLIGQVRRLALTVVTVGLIVALSEMCRRFVFSGYWIDWPKWSDLLLKTEFGFFMAMIVFSGLCLVYFPRGKYWRYGLNFSCGRDWWAVLPVMVLAAMAGGVFLPIQLLPNFHAYKPMLCIFITVPLACEMLWRGLAHGLLTGRNQVQNCRGTWFFSYPNVSAAILYAAFIAYLNLRPTSFNGPAGILAMIKLTFAAFAFGLAGGFVRERSMSIVSVLICHIIALVSVAAVML